MFANEMPNKLVAAEWHLEVFRHFLLQLLDGGHFDGVAGADPPEKNAADIGGQNGDFIGVNYEKMVI